MDSKMLTYPHSESQMSITGSTVWMKEITIILVYICFIHMHSKATIECPKNALLISIVVEMQHLWQKSSRRLSVRSDGRRRSDEIQSKVDLSARPSDPRSWVDQCNVLVPASSTALAMTQLPQNVKIFWRQAGWFFIHSNHLMDHRVMVQFSYWFRFWPLPSWYFLSKICRLTVQSTYWFNFWSVPTWNH